MKNAAAIQIQITADMNREFLPAHQNRAAGDRLGYFLPAVSFGMPSQSLAPCGKRDIFRNEFRQIAAPEDFLRCAERTPAMKARPPVFRVVRRADQLREPGHLAPT